MKHIQEAKLGLAERRVHTIVMDLATKFCRAQAWQLLGYKAKFCYGSMHSVEFTHAANVLSVAVTFQPSPIQKPCGEPTH